MAKRGFPTCGRSETTCGPRNRGVTDRPPIVIKLIVIDYWFDLFWKHNRVIDHRERIGTAVLEKLFSDDYAAENLEKRPFE